MELDITHFFTEAAPRDYSASVAEIGRDAARTTWNAALDDTEHFPELLDTDEKREAFRAHVKGFGAWEESEIRAWSNDELTALLMQMIAGDMREGGLDAWKVDWADYEQGATDGAYSGRIFRGDDGRVYYYIGE